MPLSFEEDEDLQPSEHDLDAIGAALSATPQEKPETPAVGGGQPQEPQSTKDDDYSFKVDPQLSADIETAGPVAPKSQPKFDYASVLAEKPMSKEYDDDAIKSAQKHDRDSYYDNRIYDALRAAGTRTPVTFTDAPPSTADALMKRRQMAQGNDDKNRAMRLKLLELQQKGEPKAGMDPTERALKEAQTKHYEGLTGTQAEDAKRKAAHDAAVEERARMKSAGDSDSETGKSFEDDRAAMQAALRARGGIYKNVDLSAFKTRTGMNKFLDRTAMSRGSKYGDAAKTPNPENNRIPFLGGHLEPRAGTTPSKDDRKEAQKVAAGFGGAFKSMDGLEEALKEYASHPSMETKRNVDSRVRVVSTSLNSALGQGAMAETEARAIGDALGGDLVSPTGVQAFVEAFTSEDPEKASKTLLTRLNAARASAKETAAGKYEAYNFEHHAGAPKGGEHAGVKPEHLAPLPKMGMIHVRKGSDVREIDPDDLAEAKADGYELTR